MLIASLDGEEVNADRLPGSFVPWRDICRGARCVHYDEVAGVIHIWNGNGTVKTYDACGRMIDFWKYSRPVNLGKVIADMKTRSGVS